MSTLQHYEYRRTLWSKIANFPNSFQEVEICMRRLKIHITDFSGGGAQHYEWWNISQAGTLFQSCCRVQIFIRKFATALAATSFKVLPRWLPPLCLLSSFPKWVSCRLTAKQSCLSIVATYLLVCLLSGYILCQKCRMHWCAFDTDTA